jgi:hypothetical protein
VERPRRWPVSCGKRFFCAVGLEKSPLPESGTSSRPRESGTDPSLLEAKRTSPREKMTSFGSRTFKGKLAPGAADPQVVKPADSSWTRKTCLPQAGKATAKLAALVAARAGNGPESQKRPGTGPTTGVSSSGTDGCQKHFPMFWLCFEKPVETWGRGFPEK